MELEDFAGLVGVPVVIGMVEAAKRMWPDCDQRWIPGIALLASAVVNVPVGWRLGTDPVLVLLLTIVTSLAASGLFGQTRTLTTKVKKTLSKQIKC